jgi:hypothetical protein
MDEMKKSDIIGGIVLLSMWTVMIFLLGSIWQLEQDLKAVKQIDITTKIVEYRLGTTTIHKDTVDVVKYKTKVKYDTAWFERPLDYDYRKRKP